MPYLYPSLRTTLPVAGYYARLDAGAAATDQFTADGSQDGTLTNGATRANDGGLAYSFDGTNDHITLSPAILIPATASWTLSAWVKPSVITESTWFSQYQPVDGRFIVRIDGGNYVLFCGGGEGTFSIGSTAAVANTWAHIAITRSSKTFAIYVNGISAGTRTDSGTRSILQYKSLIAKRESDGTSENHFTGLIDDLLVWNSVALGTTEIGYLASQRGAIYAATQDDEAGMFGGISGAMTGGMAS
jgi:hypothetical protein